MIVNYIPDSQLFFGFWRLTRMLFRKRIQAGSRKELDSSLCFRVFRVFELPGPKFSHMWNWSYSIFLNDKSNVFLKPDNLKPLIIYNPSIPTQDCNYFDVYFHNCLCIYSLKKKKCQIPYIKTWILHLPILNILLKHWTSHRYRVIYFTNILLWLFPMLNTIKSTAIFSLQFLSLCMFFGYSLNINS